MNIWNWLPSLRPRHSLQSVLLELIKGLKDGSIVLEKNTPQHTTQPPPAEAPCLERAVGKPHG